MYQVLLQVVLGRLSLVKNKNVQERITKHELIEHFDTLYAMHLIPTPGWLLMVEMWGCNHSESRFLQFWVGAQVGGTLADVFQYIVTPS